MYNAIGNPFDTRIWYNGTNSLGVLQDDMAILANSTNGFGYRSDDHGNTIGSATALTKVGNTWSGAGIIGTNSDVDVFSFTVTAEDSYRIAANVAAVIVPISTPCSNCATPPGR